METTKMSREEMLERVARFSRLTGTTAGFPGADLPGCSQTVYSVIGFPQPPAEATRDGEIVWDIGEVKSVPADGFSLGYAYVTPGNGNVLHNHDTNETFIFVTGTWRVHWNEDDDEYLDFGPLDVISVPAGVPRRYTNLASTSGDPNEASLVIAVVTGNDPITVTESWVLDEAKATGRFTPLADRGDR